MKRSIWLIAALLLSLTLVSASLPGGDASAQTAPADLPTGTFVARVYYQDPQDLTLLSDFDVFEYNNKKEGYVLVALNSADYAYLEGLGFRLAVDQAETEAFNRVPANLPGQVDGIPGYPCYRTVEETYQTAEDIVADYPQLATWIDVGDSWEKTVLGGLPGYDMQVLKLTNAAIPGPKPKFFATFSIHAREYTPAELGTRFAEYLVQNYGVDADATWLLDWHEIHLMFQANPDGRKHAEAGEYWRKNTNENYCSPTSTNRGADLNRNFPFQWGCCGGSSGSQCSETYRGPTPASEPEVQAIRDYLRAIFPDQRPDPLPEPAPDDATGVYMDIHSYSELVLWPWGFTGTVPPNGPQLQTLGRKFAYYNHYTPEQAIGLYPTDGTTDDFAYGDLGVAAYTFELGTSFFQSCPVFENTILPDNMPALIYAAKVVRTPYLTPSGPDSLGVTATPATVTLGDPSTLTATVDDTRFNNSSGTEPTQNIMAAEYYVDVPPWDTGNNPQPHPMAPADGSFNSPVEAVTGQVDTATLTPGRHLLFVRGQDADGNWGAFSAAFLDVQLPPAPDFTLHATPSSQTICAPADAVYDVAVGSLLGYNDPVTLSAGNTPPGTSVAFSTNPVTPPASSQLTVGNTGSGTAGSYAIDVVGVGSSGVHTSTVGLDLYTAAAAAPALQNPPNGAINVPADVTFFWDPAAQASNYTIEIATDSGFTNIVDSATVAGTSYTSVALITSTPYYWHVTADNLCGANTSSTFSFVTISGPVVYCSQPGLAIPDNNGTGVTDTLVVPANLDIADLNVVLRATHTWVGDLRFSLQHVDTGTSAVFYDRPGVPASTFGCSVDNVDATVDDQGTDGDLETTCLPTPPAIAGSLVGGDPPNASLLAAFEDEDANGSWVITAADLAGGDTGVLTEWCLEVTAACYDFNGTGRVDVADVQSVSGAWGTNNPLYDLDHNGTVNVNDIQIIANKWNTFCSVQ